MGSLASINIKFFADLKQFSTQMQNSQRKIQKMGKNLQSVGKSLSFSLTAPLVGIAGLALKASADLETLETGFESMLGSAEKAKDLTKELIDFTAKTPFQLEGVGKSAKQLLAFGVAQEDVLGRLKTLGDISAGANVPLNEMAAIFGKVKAKGKAMTEEILQMSDRGIPIIQVLADQFGVAKSEIFEMAKEGKISFEAISLGLETMSGKGGIFADQMAKQSNTLAGLFSTLRDNIGLALGELGTAISETINLKEVMKKVTTAIQNAVKWFKELSPTMRKAIIVIAAMTAAIGPLLIALGFLMTSVVPGLITVFTFLSTTVLPAVVSGFTALNAAIIANPIGLLVAAVAAIGFGFVSMLQSITPVVSKLRTFFNLVKSGGNYASYMKLQMESVADAFKEQDKAAEEAAKAQAEFEQGQKDAALAAQALTDSLKKQSTELIKIKGLSGRSKGNDIPIGEANGISATVAEVDLPSLEPVREYAQELTNFEIKMLEFQNASAAIMEGVAVNFVEGFASVISSIIQGNAGMGAVFGLMLNTIADLAQSLGKAAISIGITMLAVKQAFKTPLGAIAAGAGLLIVAGLIRGIASNFGGGSDAGAFANGGIVGGNSFYGDKLFARVNSGEAIFNEKQQKSLYNQLATPGSQAVHVTLGGGFELDGRKLKLVLDRTDSQLNRTR